MKEITDENLISILQKQFPGFIPYCEASIEYFGIDQGLTVRIIPFSDYVLDVMKRNQELLLRQIFDFVELSICDGDESVQNAMTTSFLEYLLSKDPHEIKFASIVKYLGKESMGYCKAWDRFCGIRTKGLWDDESLKSKFLWWFKKTSAKFGRKPPLF